VGGRSGQKILQKCSPGMQYLQAGHRTKKFVGNLKNSYWDLPST